MLIFRTELSIYAFAGIIMLIGLVKKNGIMMIDFALEAQRLEGKGPEDAIVEACAVRFRPIMMTTMAALMAGLPIALGFGAGAEARRPVRRRNAGDGAPRQARHAARRNGPRHSCSVSVSGSAPFTSSNGPEAVRSPATAETS